MVERLGKTAEIPKPVHPHVLRHTFATRAAARGVDPLMLADQLGHTILTMVPSVHPAQRAAEGRPLGPDLEGVVTLAFLLL